MDVTFHFDPVCPWTWRASRWLRQVTEMRDVSVEWAPLSLAILNEGKITEAYREPLEASFSALRLVEALRSGGRHDEAGRLYTEIGERTHTKGTLISAAVVREAVTAAGLSAEAAVLDDTSWDDAVRAAHEKAIASAGPDVGSPVLTTPSAERGLHGPILAGIPDPEESLAIWASIEPLLRSRIFLEVRRGRR